MPEPIAVSFLPGTRGHLRAPEIRRIVRQIFDSEDISRRVTVEVVLADATTVRELNRLYRGKDEDTDVLSFADDEGEPFLHSPDESPTLGEIVVSVPFVQAQVAGLQPTNATVTIAGQLAHLLVHGLLHLAGLDHERSEADEDAMREKEEALLTQLGYEGLYVHGH